jgi:glycosyltransferase involved in cell wall biosynthesis
VTSDLHVVLPNDIDDPAAPSGGNTYDRRVLDGLAASGRTVHEYGVPGTWPAPRPADRVRLAAVLAGFPDGATVLLDGLVASCVPDVLVPEAERLRLVVLVHLPLEDAAEAAVLGAARAVIATSPWTRGRLLERYGLDRVHVAVPGVDPAPVVTANPDGTRLRCVAAVAPHKGHDVLVEALAAVADLAWTCTCVGPLDRDPAFVASLRRDPRIALVGPRGGDGIYAGTDLLVHPSRGETYGMVVTEALARGIPVVATDARGLPDALGYAPDGTRPGLLVPPGDGYALGAALRRWLTNPALRDRLRRRALARRGTLAGWDGTVIEVSKILDGVSG